MFRYISGAALLSQKVYPNRNVGRIAVLHGRWLSQQAKAQPKDRKATTQQASSVPQSSIDQQPTVEQSANAQQLTADELQANDLQLPHERPLIVQYPPNYQPPDTDVWRRIFHMHQMKYFAIFSKLKFYPLIIGGVGASFTGALHAFDVLPQVSMMVPLSLGVYNTLALCAYSKWLSNTVAIINTDSTKKSVQLFYIDFMGNRQCVEALVAEVRKMEQHVPWHGLYKVVKMRHEDIAIDLKVPLKRIHVFDVSMYRKLFGKRKAAAI